MPVRRPGTGAALGVLIGFAVAVILQQQGVWPLDKITVFLLPAATGIIGIIVTSVGRTGATTSLTISLIVLVPMAAWGATDIPNINETGVLNGGCMVIAASDVDNTVVTDTSRGDPFDIDPNGGLTWAATSGAPITDHTWEISVEIGGAAVPIESGGHPNDGLSTGNFGDVGNITEYAEERGIPLDQLRGVFIVGGFISGSSECDGFGFVRLLSEPLETLVAKIALAIAIAALIALLIVALRGRGGGTGTPGDLDADAAAAGAAGGVGAGAGDDDGDDDLDVEEEPPIFEDGFESGDTSAWSDEQP